MSSYWWLTSLTCTSPVIQSTDTFMTAIEWVRFIFLSPCPQRLLFSAVDVLFLCTLLVLAVQKICSRFSSGNDPMRKPLLEGSKPQFRATLWFKLTFLVTSLLAIASVVFCVLGFVLVTGSSWEVEEAVFRLIQAIARVGVVILVVHEKKFNAIAHPLPLRIYWIANFVLVCAFAVSSVSRLLLASESSVDSSLRMDDILYLCEIPCSVFLLVVAMTTRGLTGINEVSDSGSKLHEEALAPNVSRYASASFFSKLFWFWVNPIINKGYTSTLNLEDVPILPHNFRAKNTSELFATKWPSPAEKSEHPVRTALIRCFWKDLVFTGILCVIRLAVMYAGPVLVDSFVAFTSGKGSSPNEGYLLVLVLLIAKTIEVLSSHHFNFETMQLGMLIRSSLTSTLFRKGLRLSCSSRQAHGAGQIVNYMAVDVQQLGDTVQYLHSIWLMPMQVGVALALLYGNLGIATLVALVGVIVVLLFVIWRTRENNLYQYQVMRNRDSRIKATMEMINNMRVIKLQAWEDFFGERVRSFRQQEFGWIGKFLYSMALNLTVLWNTPVMLAVLVFAVAIATGIRLDAGTVFTATTIFKILQEPVRNFPQSLTQISQAMIALERLDKYMKSRELDQASVEREEGCSSDIAVEVKDGSFSWDDEATEKVLSDLNIEIKKGEFAAIVGTVGSGKSSLLSSILGEMHKISGKVSVCGSTAYVPQSAWIQNSTIEENILFGLPMNRERYMETIRVCSLERDLEIMEFGDQTEIGERGINLSGGQKQRIQLARAVYQDCDIYLLDDVFSAVDAQTASDLFKECVRGALRQKTVLLVTHQVDFLHNADVILVMRDGRVVQSGKYEDLLGAGLDFGALVAAHDTSMEIVGMSNSTNENSSSETPKSNKPSVQVEMNGHDKSVGEPKSDKGTSKLIEEEEREEGRVSWNVYKKYFTKSYGWWGVISFIIVSLLWQLSLMASDLWLAYETSEDREFLPNLFITVYAILAAGSCIIVGFRAFYLTFLGLKTSQSFFDQMLNSILHAPMSFFDTTPSGRILSRASTDQVNIDILIPMFLGMVLVMYFSVIGIIFVTCIYSWPTTFLVIPLIWVNIWYRGYFITTSRELTRLDSITKAPIIHHFSETVSGITTIRCFRKQSSFIQENINKVDANLRMVFYNNGANEWLGFRLEFLGCCFLCLSTMFMIMLPSSIIKPEYVGMSLSYGLSLNVVLFYAIFMTCMVENRMVSVERIEQFINLASEAQWNIPGCLPSPNWPTHGNIEIKDLKVRYRSNTPLVLKGMTLSINSGEKIGIVGRTGSGKSTLIQVFFRLVEPSGGKIIVDGVDICKLGLHDLRSRFGIIPQEPVLFQGTVRSNIDPIGLYSDEEIWKALDRCRLKDVVAAKPDKLDSSVADSGENWSMGQRQLLCLGRVLLKQTRILFLDEATASVDSQTDGIIQKIIREDFSSCTIVSIAHRIPTIMDCNRVLVVDDGKAREFDKPSRLLERASIFAALVQEYANRSSG